MEKNEIIALVRTLMNQRRPMVNTRRPFVLATSGPEGAPQMRWMGDLMLEDPLTVYMACGAQSRKMDQIRVNQNAQLMFQSEGFGQVATLSGTCEICDDAETKMRIWKAMPVVASYVSGPDDPNLGVLHFITRKVELLMMHDHGMTPFVAEL
jgi:general stress protein 26